MKEVSTRMLLMFFRRLKREGRPEGLLMDGVPYTLEHLKNKHERIDWSAFLRFMENAGRVWSDEQLIDIGASTFKSPFLLPVKLIGRLLFTPKDFYVWINSTTGNQFFSCMEAGWREVGPNRIITELKVKDGYAPCHGFFVVSLGAFKCFPNVVGMRNAEVEVLESGERSWTYDIRFPVGGGVLTWLRKTLVWPFTVKAVARELKDAHVQLLARYNELDDAKRTLALQATQLQTAHSIAQVIHRELDLDRTIAAVAEALVSVGKFAAARVGVSTELEGQKLEREASAGDVPTQGEPLTLPLSGRVEHLGELTLWCSPGQSGEDAMELLKYVMSTVSVTIEDAITFTALSHYRQHLEDRVTQRTSELRAATETLTGTLAQLQAAQGAREKIFANINHEIRTPLALIKLAVSDLHKRFGSTLDDTGRGDLEAITGAVRKLLRLIDDLLSLATAEEGKLAVRPTHCDLAATLSQVVATFTPAANADRLALGYRGPSRALAYCDEGAVERIVANLVSNAIKFTPTGGQIDVGLEERDDAFEITVRDNGIGVDDEFLARAFGRFEQGRPSLKRGIRGSGLGLSLVKELAEAHGGRVGIERVRSGGTLFRVSLPRRKAELSARLSDLRSPPAVTPSMLPADFGLEARPVDLPALAALNPAATVLIAEDDAALAAALGRHLSPHYRVLLAHDGMAALRLVESHLPDCLITDLDMPGMDGLELARRFREVPGNRLAPVLMLTSFVQIADRLKGFEAGVVDYIAKPFEPDELLARVRSQLAVRDLALKLHQSEQLAAMGTLVAGLAHELRNPINVIVNALAPLRKLLPAEALAAGTPAGRLFAVLEECSQTVAQLSRQLLGFKRPGNLEREPVAVGTLVERALTLVGSEVSGVEVRRQLDYAGDVSCAGPLVVQVLTNLIINGAHAARPGGWVVVRSSLADDKVVIEVSDSGSGVPPELREKIFEPFFTTKPPGQGTGLGLHTAREIAVQHGGNLVVRGGGCDWAFRLELPQPGPDASRLARSS